MRARLTRISNENEANEQVDDLLGSLGSVGGSTEESLNKIKIEALSGRLAEEFAARAQLEQQIQEQAVERFEHLRNAQDKIEDLERIASERAAHLARICAKLCDKCCSY